jgi:plasmid stabilization system protein ParE
MNRYAVDWAVTARADLEEIAAYIADDSPINALAVVERIEARAQTLSTLPMRGRVVPELQWHGVTTFQELIELPWRMIYRIDGLTVHVVGVLDGRRQLEDLLLARFLRH